LSRDLPIEADRPSFFLATEARPANTTHTAHLVALQISVAAAAVKAASVQSADLPPAAMDASSLMGSSSDAPTSGEHRMGTTIVGVCYDGGVVLAADSRTSTGMLRLPPISVSAPGAGVSSLRRC
jgi:hypothetical protein